MFFAIYLATAWNCHAKFLHIYYLLYTYKNVKQRFILFNYGKVTEY